MNLRFLRLILFPRPWDVLWRINVMYRVKRVLNFLHIRRVDIDFSIYSKDESQLGGAYDTWAEGRAALNEHGPGYVMYCWRTEYWLGRQVRCHVVDKCEFKELT